MQHYYHTIESNFLNNSYLVGNSGKRFASPLKELNQQTILTENTKLGSNDSFRQRTKYDDKIDSYYSSYDLGSLIGNEKSYLEGSLSKDDVDYYSFNYGQKAFYDKMGVSTSVKIQLENISGSDGIELSLYDTKGNYIGTAKDNGKGCKELVIPDYYGCCNQFIIRVSGKDGLDTAGKKYHIKINETRSDSPNEVRNLNDIHREQYMQLSDSEKYSGNESVDTLLKKWASGKTLSESERKYIEVFSNLADYEKAESSNYIRNKIFPQIKSDVDNADINSGNDYEIKIDIHGNVTVSGDLNEYEKEEIKKIISDKYKGELWDSYLKASDLSVSDYRLVEAYKEVCDFLEKATGGEYSFESISVDSNCKISGLPNKMCDLLNSQDSNARYEELRDDILMLTDYKNANGMAAIYGTEARFGFTQEGIAIIS